MNFEMLSLVGLLFPP